MYSHVDFNPLCACLPVAASMGRRSIRPDDFYLCYKLQAFVTTRAGQKRKEAVSFCENKICST